MDAQLRCYAAQMHAGEDTSPAPSEKHRDIPSMDGLRAVSILIVILAHSAWRLPGLVRNSRLFQLPIGNGRNGVTVFFVISGFLITKLLLRELDKTGGIALRRFYFRRSMRIFPAFYLYLITIAVLLLWHVLPAMNLKSFLAAATYTWCYYPQASGYFVTHTWSLAIEEQFYLFWPALLSFLYTKAQMVRGCLAIILGMPLLRVIFYFLIPSLRGHEYYMIHGWLDVVMMGCLLAVLNRDELFLRYKRRLLNGATALAMALTLFFVAPFLLASLPKPWVGLYALVLHPFLVSSCAAGMLLYVVEQPRSLGGRFLNLSVLAKAGVLSYGLYLWQQLFVSEQMHLLPYGYLFLLVVCLAAFWLVEQPSLRLRTKVEERTPVAV